MNEADTGAGARTGDGAEADDLSGSWIDLRSSALVGTGRRRVPEVALVATIGARPAADIDDDLTPSATALLDAAAVIGAGRRAGGRTLDAAAVGALAPPPASDDATPVAGAVAVSLLELLLGPMPPAGTHRVELVAHWLASADATDRRVPPRLLVPLLDHATANPAQRATASVVLGERGRWLAGLNPDWAWAAVEQVIGSIGGTGRADRLGTVAAADPDEWARLGSSARIAVLRATRAADPAAGRELLATTWSTDPATARVAHLSVLADGLADADEDLLEAALDDRAASVRQQAMALLDGLPTSARARRMAERLAPLVRVEGRWRNRSLAVALPDDPDAAAVRDGLVPPPPNRSARGWWIEQLAAGAPLELWTERSGTDPAACLALLAQSGSAGGAGAGADARAGILRAVLARHDAAWAAAMFRSTPDPRLLAAVDPATRIELVTEQLRAKQRPNTVKLVALIGHVPAPWPLPFSVLVLESIRADSSPVAALVNAGPALATGLHPGAQDHLERWLAGLEDQPQVGAALRTLISFQSLHRSITEAFA